MKKLKYIISICLVLILTTVSCVYAYDVNNRALLKDLRLSQDGISPQFLPSQKNYSIFLKETTNNLDIEAIPEDSNAKVVVQGNTNLKSGDNKITINVTADNGDTQEYTIIATKSANIENSDSYLQNLIIENVELDKEFMPEEFEYDGGTVPNKITNLLVFASARQEGATVTISGNNELKEGENIIKINVKSPDGSTQKEYSVKIIREKSEEAINNVTETPSNDVEENISNNEEKDNNIYKILIAVIVIEFIIIIVLFIKVVKKK